MSTNPGPGMYGSDGTFIPYISEEEFTAMFDIDYTPDPVRVTWIQSGQSASGTLQEYADLWESREYGDDEPDLHNGLSTHAVYWESDDKEPLRLPIHIVRERSYVDEGTDRCWIPVRFSLDIPGMPNGSVAVVNLDGDA